MSTATMVSLRSALLIAVHIVELIPLNTDENKKFNYELMKLVIEDFTYKSSEILTHSISWQRLESILKRHIQRCDEIWKVDIVDLYNGKLEIKSAIPNDSW
jgi:mevalonate kinase